MKNMVKLVMVIVDEFSQILRDVLQNHIPPGNICSTVMRKKLPLRPEQQTLISSANTTGYAPFDVTLLYTLIRNLCNKLKPTNGWGIPPRPGDELLADDIERIRLLRNTVFGHVPSTSVSDPDFNRHWSEITGICKRVDVKLKTKYSDNIQQIKQKVEDEEIEETYIQILENETPLQNEFYGLRHNIEQVKEMLTQNTEGEKHQAFTKMSVNITSTKNYKSIERVAFDSIRAVIDEIDEHTNLKAFYEIVDPLEFNGIDGICYPRLVKLLSKLCAKVRWYKSIKRSNKSKVLLRFIKITFELMTRYKAHKLKSSRGCIILKLEFQSLDDVNRYQDDVENGKLKMLLDEAFHYRLFLSAFGFEKKDINLGIENLNKDQATTQDRKNNELHEHLWHSSRNGNQSMVKKILRDVTFQFDEYWRGNDRTTPLYQASINGHFAITKLLVKRKTILDLCAIDETTPLYAASYFGHDDIVQFLCNANASLNFGNKDGATPLYIATERGHLRTLQILLDMNADVNLCNKNGSSPLFIACQNGNDKIADFLLSNGADIDIRCKTGASALLITSQKGHFSVTKLLLERGADINLSRNDRTSPLNVACQNGHREIVQILLEHNADVNLCNNENAGPLYSAIFQGYEHIAHLLIEKGADVNNRIIEGATPLFVSCQMGFDSIVTLLLKKGADTNIYHGENTSPLFIATQKGHLSIGKLLLENGANVDLSRTDETTPLHVACQKGHTKCVQMLLNYKANVNLCKNGEISPLYIASLRGKTLIARLLINKGADVNIRDTEGRTPLLVACQGGYELTAMLLLQKGANVNICNNNHESPLHVASQNGHEAIVRLLLNNRGNINLKTKNGNSALDIAINYQHESILNLLLDSDAKIDKATLRRLSQSNMVYSKKVKRNFRLYSKDFRRSIAKKRKQVLEQNKSSTTPSISSAEQVKEIRDG